MTLAPQGHSLELFFIDGKPDGMQTAEEINWTGHVLLTPRTRIADALKRDKAQHTGVYLLLGNDLLGNDGETGEPMLTGEPLLYVGESENMADRIRGHDTQKDWWTTAVLITTGANTLHKAHVRYLEARLVEIARSVKRIGLDNANQPGGASLPEAAENSMERFLDILMMVLPAMRIDCFLEQSSLAMLPEREDRGVPVFVLSSARHGLKAKAVLQDGELVVQAGSIARKQWERVNNNDHSYAKLTKELVKTEVLAIEAKHSVFTRNYAFRSPSAAASVILGRVANGPKEWKLRDSDKTYKEWETEQLEATHVEAMG